MWTVSIKDANVIAEWKRQLTEYEAKASWLRIPFYGGLAVGILAVYFLPSAAAPYVVGAEVVNLIIIGWFLSKYSYNSIVCPHCKDRPIRPRMKQVDLSALEFCERCGYWLVDNEAKS